LTIRTAATPCRGYAALGTWSFALPSGTGCTMPRTGSQIVGTVHKRAPPQVRALFRCAPSPAATRCFLWRPARTHRAPTGSRAKHHPAFPCGGFRTVTTFFLSTTCPLALCRPARHNAAAVEELPVTYVSLSPCRPQPRISRLPQQAAVA
jgi:hypothetical protein